jgi:acyl carrier protein
MTMTTETMSDRITRLLIQYAQSAGPTRPLAPTLSIREELAVESLSLVSVLVDLGAELEVDINESGVELSRIQTVGDLIALGERLSITQRGQES